ncbi:hypothetical protein ABIE56_004447 [Luteibacter sp. 621]|uniref:hypothetical protein n=1 Tax=Luteibacter sp. 621 TaxID=3373916 RepID=UPI003D24E06E
MITTYRAHRPIKSTITAIEPPWVKGTVNDEGKVLRLADVTGPSVQVEVYSHGGLKGEWIKVRWASVAAAWLQNVDAVPPYESPLIEITRDNAALDVAIPKDEANARAGRVAVSYEVYKAQGGTVPSPIYNLDVEAGGSLMPVEVAEAVDGKILLANVPPGGATVRAPSQASIPSGSTVRFFWEGTDVGGQPVKGYDEVRSTGGSATEGTLPKADLQRVAGKIAIRYTVDTPLPAGVSASPEDHFESEWVQFDVVGAASYPAPRVEETGGADTLLPHAARDGATVLIEADLVATDSVTVTFGSYTSPPQAGSRPLRIKVPPPVVGQHLGQLVDVFFTVTRGGTSQSQVLALNIGRLNDGDPQLPKPRIDRADTITNILDLSTFTESPEVLVDPWLLIGVGQTVWLNLQGFDGDGKPATIIIYSGTPVTQDMIATGLEVPVDRGLLETWQNASNLIATCKVNFSGGSEGGAVVFTTSTFKLLTGGTAIRGRMYEIEQFEDPATIVPNGQTYRLRFARIRPIGGRLQSASTNGTYLKGRHVRLNEQLASVTARITLDHAATAAQIDVKPSSASFPLQVIAYDTDGIEINRYPATSETRLRIKPTGTQRVAALEVISPQGYYADFDNLQVTTGGTWDIRQTPVTETFNDLPLGTHGDHYEFDRWYINANGGEVAIENAPGGMHGHVLAIHMDPEGKVHQLTPQYAVCPRIHVSLYVRASSVTGHAADVSVIYINREDLTLRTVNKRVQLSQSAQRVIFDAVSDVARDVEYVSHIRIVHSNGTTVTTVFYDDITFE